MSIIRQGSLVDLQDLYDLESTQRTAVECVNADRKEYFQLDNVRYRTDRGAKVHFDFVTLVYNVSKLPCDRINRMSNQ